MSGIPEGSDTPNPERAGEFLLAVLEWVMETEGREQQAEVMESIGYASLPTGYASL